MTDSKRKIKKLSDFRAEGEDPKDTLDRNKLTGQRVQIQFAKTIRNRWGWVFMCNVLLNDNKETYRLFLTVGQTKYLLDNGYTGTEALEISFEDNGNGGVFMTDWDESFILKYPTLKIEDLLLIR